MTGPDLTTWLPAVWAVAAWPIVVVWSWCVLVLAPPGQQAAVLAGVADLVRAVRSRANGVGEGQDGAGRAELTVITGTAAQDTSVEQGATGARPTGVDLPVDRFGAGVAGPKRERSGPRIALERLELDFLPEPAAVLHLPAAPREPLPRKPRIPPGNPANYSC